MHEDAGFRSRYGPAALVAGAAVGLGAAWARHLAARGLDLVLVDVDASALRTTADAIARGGARVTPVVADLARPDLVEVLAAQVAADDVGLLVYNAALGLIGPLVEADPARIDAAIAVNCRAPLRLIQWLVPGMMARRRGGVALMSSLSGNVGSAQLAVYAATKAFTLVLADALWAELRPHGVDVLAVQPGSTRTPGWQESQPADVDASGMPVMEPDDVVAEALGALGSEPVIVPGDLNRQAAQAIGALPRAQAIDLMSQVTSRLLRRA